MLIIAVIFVGFLTGFINTLAGSGSLLSLPMLMALGLPANVANGTNRIAILMQSAVAVRTFKSRDIFTWREGLQLTLPSIVGSIVGASLAVNINEHIMKQTIAGLLVFMLILMIYNPERWVKGKAGLMKEKPSILQIVIFFVIGVYGGFIQAGVGFFMLAGLVLAAGFDLVKANAIKVLKVLSYTPFALAVFIYNNQVDYLYGLILGVGSMAGAYTASKYAMNWGAKAVQYFVMGALALSAMYMFGLFDFMKK